MKIRYAFISNSSATSFHIYGWSSNSLDYNYIYNNLDKINHLISTAFPDSKEIFNEEYGIDDYIGLGNWEDEIDHDDEDWQDYQTDPPTALQKRIVDFVQQDLNLSKPEHYSDTWFNG